MDIFGQSLKTTAIMLAEGNPGAINVIANLCKHYESLDPYNVFKEMAPLVFFAEQDITGPAIWMLYKDVCKEDLKNVVIVMRAYQMGLLSAEELKERVHNTRYGAGFSPLNFDDLLSKLRMILPELCVAPVA